MTLTAQNIFIAHRGASYLAPENTVASAKLAWELGADAVECDVQLSKENKVMIIHDKNTKRTSGKKDSLVIKKTLSEQLRKVDVGSWKDEKYKGEKIPFLTQLIETVPSGKTLVVEIKCGVEILPKLKKCVKQSGKQHQIVFIAFGWETILQTQKEFPNNKCYWLSSSKLGLSKKMKEAANAGLAGINLSHSIVNKDIIKKAKALNLEVLTWTVDDPKEAQRLTNIGVTGITTNRPKWLKEKIILDN